jgi:hypothetical protein
VATNDALSLVLNVSVATIVQLSLQIDIFFMNTSFGLKHYLIKQKMSNLLYLIAVILIIAWAIGFFAYSTGGIIHILLVIAVIAIIFRLIRGNSAF